MRNTVTRSYDLHTAGAHEFVLVFVLVLKSMSILPPAIVLYHDISGNLQSKPILVLIIVIRDFLLEKKPLHPQHPTLYRDDGEPAPSLSGLGHTACRPTSCPASEKTKRPSSRV